MRTGRDGRANNAKRLTPRFGQVAQETAVHPTPVLLSFLPFVSFVPFVVKKHRQADADGQEAFTTKNTKSTKGLREEEEEEEEEKEEEQEGMAERTMRSA